MKSSLRLALLACASFIGLALAGPAFAAFDPSLTIEQSSYKPGARVTADVFIFSKQANDPIAKVTIFSPAGYASNLSAAPGTTIGRVAAIAKVNDLGGALFGLHGNVVVANPADPTIQQTSTLCTQSPTNQAVWVLNATLSGQALSIPVFVNKVGPFTTLQVCLRPPDLPQGTPGRQPLGAQLVSADFTINNVFTNGPRGEYEWSGIFTPYTPRAGTPNAAGTVEWRTYVGLPSTLTLAKAKTANGIKLVGKLTVNGLSPRNVRLGLYSGRKGGPAPNAVSAGTGKKVAQTRSLPASGRYALSRPSVKFATFFQMRFENYGTPSCPTPSPTGLPVRCIGEDLAAVTSNQVKATKPRKKR
jgi:hypothetical protein